MLSNKSVAWLLTESHWPFLVLRKLNLNVYIIMFWDACRKEYMIFEPKLNYLSYHSSNLSGASIIRSENLERVKFIGNLQSTSSIPVDIL